MRLELLRYSTSDESTLGALLIDGTFACYTLEDAFHVAKIPGQTRIPEGIYDLKLRTEGGMHADYGRKYPFHRGMLWLQSVPQFEWVYIHVGNRAAHSEGCLLVGLTANCNQIEDGFVGKSVQAYERIYPGIADAVLGDTATVEIRAVG